MKRQKLNLSQLSVSSFITTVAEQKQVKGGTICPDVSNAGPTLCITGAECETLVEETCHSTGNTDDPTGRFSAPTVCV